MQFSQLILQIVTEITGFTTFNSATPGGILDRAIDKENEEHGDFLRLVLD